MSRICALAEGAAIEVVAAEDDVIDVHLLNQAVDSRAGGMDLGRDSGLIVSAQPIVTRQRVRSMGMKALAKDLREGFADPLQARRARDAFSKGSTMRCHSELGGLGVGADDGRPRATRKRR